MISDKQLPLKQVISSYFFNSQFIAVSENHFLLICPERCKDHSAVQNCIAYIKDSLNVTIDVVYVDLTESIKNGGGPACLRGFGVLTDSEIKCLDSRYLLTEELADTLKTFISEYYPDQLDFDSMYQVDLVNYSEKIIIELNRLFE